MPDNTGTWGEYGKLVIKELEHINDTYDRMRTDMDSCFLDLNNKLNEIKNIEGKVSNNSRWIDNVNEIWSPTQMKEAKDEIYKQKNRWVAVIAVFTFIQAAIGIAIVVWGNLKK